MILMRLMIQSNYPLSQKANYGLLVGSESFQNYMRAIS